MINLRSATNEDAAPLAALTTELGYPVGAEAMRVRLAHLLPQPDQKVFVAEVGHQVAGWLQAQGTETLESGFRVEIVGLVVRQAYRRIGIGRLLVRQAEQWAQQLGAGTVVVRSNAQRTESHQFYPAMGFTATKTQTVYCKVLCAPQNRAD